MSQDKNIPAYPRVTRAQYDADLLIRCSAFFETPRAYLDFFTEMHIAHLNYIVISKEDLHQEIVDLYENLYIFLKKVQEFSETHRPEKKKKRSANG